MNRKRSHRAQALRNPVAAAILKRQIQQSVRSMHTDAMLQALIGANDAKLIDDAGRLAYITAEAARACRLPDQHAPDLRIIAGMANALYDLAQGRGDGDLHRLSIASGLQACERLLPLCDTWAIGTAALKVDELIMSGEGLSVHHIMQPTHNERSAKCA